MEGIKVERDGIMDRWVSCWFSHLLMYGVEFRSVKRLRT